MYPWNRPDLMLGTDEPSCVDRPGAQGLLRRQTRVGKELHLADRDDGILDRFTGGIVGPCDERDTPTEPDGPPDALEVRRTDLRCPLDLPPVKA